MSGDAFIPLVVVVVGPLVVVPVSKRLLFVRALEHGASLR